MQITDSRLNFLAGGGDTGEMIRRLEWSQTSLGDPSDWPQSLKTCVRIILTSRQPMFVWWGPDLINIYNDPYRAIVGGKHPRALGQRAREVWHEIWEQVAPRVETALNTNEGTYDESLLLIMERNGYPEETYYTFSYSPVPGEDGRPAGIICANTDDTERIVNERQLRTLKDLGKVLIDSKSDEDIYSRTIKIIKENAQDFPFASIYAAAEGELVLKDSTSEVDEVLFPSMIGREQAAPWYLHEAISTQLPKLSKVYNSALPSGAWPIPPNEVLTLPIFQNGKQVSLGALVIGISPYRLLDDRYLSFFSLIADQIAVGIGNVRAYEEERQRMTALMEIDKAKTVFFNNVSHEFRTPLTLMLGPLEEMMQLPDTGMIPGFKDGTRSVYRNAQRLLKLVNSLLEFSRIEAGRVQANFRPVDLSAFTADLSSNFQSVMEKAGLTFEVICMPLGQPVYVDAEMWEKIVLNLLSNAFKYTLSGKVSVELTEAQGQVVLRVEDTGVGIPERELPRMFERFHRIPGSAGRTYEGTGIGLSLIQELIHMHGGTITVESTEGAGSVFIIMIPLGKAHLPQDQVREETLSPAVTTAAASFLNEATSLLSGNHNDFATSVAADRELFRQDKDIRVMVVDDNADMRAYLCRLLEPHYTVFTAVNGRDALNQLDMVNPQLLISDMMMPLVDGQQLVRHIRSDINRLRLPVILLSARAGEEARVEGLEAGADDYLVKPFSAKELLTKVHSQINLARERNHAEELLKRLFIHAPMAITILRGPQFLVEVANDLMLDIWGRDQGAVIGKPIFEALPELEGQGFDLMLEEVRQTGKRYVSAEREVSIYRKGKLDKVYVKFIYEPMREPDGNISGVIALAHEITDLVIARGRAEAGEAQMRQLLQQKDEFLSIASHELKTPLTSMKAILQILERMDSPDAAVNGFVRKASRQMDKLTSLVADLLDVSSIQAGKMKFYPEDFILHDMLVDIIEQHQQSQESHTILFRGNARVKINGDRNRLEQVLNNLIANAIKYSPDADQIEVLAALKEGEIKVSVKDDGIGIPTEQMPHVFDRFFRIEEGARNFSGLGLGLYISKEIVERHQGRIGVEQNPDKGSLFWFTLPA